jgi:hypothetical protein
MRTVIRLAGGEFKDALDLRKSFESARVVDHRHCFVRGAQPVQRFGNAAIPIPHPRNRERLAWGAGGGNERPCSPAGCRRNSLRTIRLRRSTASAFLFASFTSWLGGSSSRATVAGGFMVSPSFMPALPSIRALPAR